MNPADLPTRGSSANELIKSNWWEVPNGLKIPWKTGRNSRKRNLFAENEAAVLPVHIQPEEAPCFQERAKYSGHGEGIPYAHRLITPEHPNQRSTTSNDHGPGKS
ncbi:hypothetical protein NPIL_264241 [Nephila pilipes]|uniref:Uncharacterized protein n=1 Tax=Nephila pilipes TaxID=299642 RepID=A0A8X6UBB1_NEPPI|nr:hypothetical protein NPIL_264241 [Nephila pilipes]